MDGDGSAQAVAAGGQGEALPNPVDTTDIEKSSASELGLVSSLAAFASGDFCPDAVVGDDNSNVFALFLGGRVMQDSNRQTWFQRRSVNERS